MTEALSNHLLLADVRSHCFFPVLVSLYFFIIVMRCQITPFLPSLYWHHCITAHCQIPPFPLRTAVLFHQSSLLLDYCQVRVLLQLYLWIIQRCQCPTQSTSALCTIWITTHCWILSDDDSVPSAPPVKWCHDINVAQVSSTTRSSFDVRPHYFSPKATSRTLCI